METHRNHLHNSPGKKFRHYFYEFIMLFLAVFAGFTAENIREHKIERTREEVYMKNLYEDLKDDISNFAEYEHSTIVYLSTIDSMMLLMNKPDRDLYMSRIYYLSRSATLKANSFFSPNDRTFEQMKYSGSLRLISNRLIADSVSGYYYSLKKIEAQNEIIKDRITDYMLAMGKVFDGQILFQIFKDKKEPDNKSIKLLTNDPIAINMLLTSTQYYYGSRMLQKNHCTERTLKAQRLLQLIKQEYHFE